MCMARTCCMGHMLVTNQHAARLSSFERLQMPLTQNVTLTETSKAARCLALREKEHHFLPCAQLDSLLPSPRVPVIGMVLGPTKVLPQPPKPVGPNTAINARCWQRTWWGCHLLRCMVQTECVPPCPAKFSYPCIQCGGWLAGAWLCRPCRRSLANGPS